MNSPAFDIQNNIITKKRILVIDDIRTDLHLIGKLISGFGHEAILAESAFQALDFIDESVDLVIIDAIMPEIDGFTFVKTMRKKYEFNIPAIMITSLSGRADRIRAIEAGVNDFVSKPVDKVELRVRINSMLKIKAAQDEVNRYQQKLEKLVEQKTSDLSLTLKKLHAVINSMNDCMLIINDRNEIVEANQAFISLAGLSGLSEIKGYDFFAVLNNKEQLDAFEQLLNTSDEMDAIDIEFKQWNNKVFSILATHIENDSHVLVMRDITGKVQEDEQRAQFLSLLSHELRTPLNGILGLTTLICDEKELLHEEHVDYIDSIHTCSEQLDLIVTELLNYVQLVNNREEVEEKYIPLEPIVERVINESDQEYLDRNIKISTYIEGDSPHIHCKEIHIVEIVRQIIGNAIKYSNENSHIDIILVSGSSNVKFICKDYGIGIPQNYLEKVFDSFYQVENYLTRTSQGLGLGLTITKRIVELNNGRIEIVSVENEGTTVTITLPLG